jgi:hypothetical protein
VDVDEELLAFASFLSHEILSASSLALVLIQVAFMPPFEPIKSQQKNLASTRLASDFLLV